MSKCINPFNLFFCKCKYFLFTSILLLGSALSYAEPLQISRIHWPPFEDQFNDETPGITIEMLQTLLPRIGFSELHVRNLPWSRVIANLKSGKTHIAPSVWYRAERKEFAHFLHPYTLNSMKLMSLADRNITIDTQADLKKYIVGALRDAAMVKDMQAWSKHLHETDDTIMSIRLLKAKRIDAVIDDQTAFEYQAKDLIDLKSLSISKYTYRTEGLYCVFTKKLPNLQEKAAAYDVELKKMMASGELAAIFQKYGVSWIEPTPDYVVTP